MDTPAFPRRSASDLIPGAIYIRLFHGRRRPDEELNDWGFDGPYIGPIEIGWTYESLRVHNPDCTDEFELPIHQSLIAFAGSYYGDMDVLHLHKSHSAAMNPLGIVLLTFDEAKAYIDRDASTPTAEATITDLRNLDQAVVEAKVLGLLVHPRRADLLESLCIHLLNELHSRMDRYESPIDGLEAKLAKLGLVRQYFHKTNGCPSRDADEATCVCWHDVGTGPLPEKRYRDPGSWRMKPMTKAQQTIAPVSVPPLNTLSDP